MRYYTYLFIFLLSNLIASSSIAGKVNETPVVHVQVYDLRCQAIQHPVGIGELNPSFSWKLSSNERSVMQFAYQITVASSLQKLESDPDMWNSGNEKSTQNTFIQYHGKPLKSAFRYYWKVKIWVNYGQKSFESNSSYFITGLLQRKDWNNAKWIGYDALPDSMKVFPGVHGSGDQLGEKAKKKSVIPYLRKEFTVKREIKQAFVFVSGLGQYVLFINGKRIDSSFLNPTWSDYTKRCYYNTFDVTSILKKGVNTIGSIVGNGFFYISRERYRKLVIAAGYPMLRLKLIIRYTDGSLNEITTDNSWKTAPSPVIYSSIYGGEDFNANKILYGWNSSGYKDRGWKTAVIGQDPGGEMQAQEAYPVEVNQIFRPVNVDSSQEKLFVYDFGQNVSGIIRMKASGHKGYRIRIIPAELLNKDGSPDQKATGQPYYLEYTFKGNGVENWQPLFTYYGFRYAAIEVFDPSGIRIHADAVKINSLLSLHTQNGVSQVGNFSCSDTLFNKIFELIRWGIRNNMSNVATDCPHREKLGWLEETHLIGASMQYNYDILQFYNKIIDDMRDAQLPDGLMPDIAPEYVVFEGGFRDSPEWGSACVLVPWYVYQCYGDKEVLRKSYAMMKRYVAYLGKKANGNLLAYGLGDWFDLGPKPPGVSQLTPLGLTASAFYFYDAAILGRVAAVLGDSVEMQKYSLLAKNIRHSFNQMYFNPETNVYATGSQTSYAVPLYFGMVDSSKYKEVFANLTDSIRANNYALTAGDIGFRYLVQVLEENNAYQLIYKMNNRDDVPGYGYQIRKGATSLTESWQALRNVSNDHMMLGHLMEWLYSGLGGIRQQMNSVGYSQILIAPQFVSGIKWVECSYNSINGSITIHWKRISKDKMQLNVTIPANTNAIILLPAENPDMIKEGGQTLNSNRSNGIHKVVREKRMTKIEVGSGIYNFTFQVTENDVLNY